MDEYTPANSTHHVQPRRVPLNGIWAGSRSVLIATTTAAAAVLAVACGGSLADSSSENDELAARAKKAVQQGQQIFRFDTFGDEAKWTDTLRLHEVISAAVDPVTALSVGLKVDAEALPPAVVQGIGDGSISLTSPATTPSLCSSSTPWSDSRAP